MSEDMKMIKRGNIPARFVAAAFGVVMALFSARLGATPDEQRTFASPELAVQAAVQASAADDAAALKAIFGSDSKDMIETGDSVQDKKGRSNFIALARAKTVIVKDPTDPHRVTFTIGAN